MKNILYLKYFFFSIVIIALVILIVDSIPTSAAPPTNSTSGVQAEIVQPATEKPVVIQTDAGVLISTAQEPTVAQATSPQNGLLVLKSHCVRCHTAQWLKKTKKTQTEWEITLAQMERMGAHLSDSEKDDLIDYLVFSVGP